MTGIPIYNVSHGTNWKKDFNIISIQTETSFYRTCKMRSQEKMVILWVRGREEKLKVQFFLFFFAFKVNNACCTGSSALMLAKQLIEGGKYVECIVL